MGLFELTRHLPLLGFFRLLQQSAFSFWKTARPNIAKSQCAIAAHRLLFFFLANLPDRLNQRARGDPVEQLVSRHQTAQIDVAAIG